RHNQNGFILAEHFSPSGLLRAQGGRWHNELTEAQLNNYQPNYTLPIGLLGGFNPYGYVFNPTGWVDPLGLEALDATGYYVYGLYEPGQTAPYYVGITNNPLNRETQHINSERLIPSNGERLEVMEQGRSMTYAEARGAEQYNIEKYGTKMATIGQDLSADGLTAEQRGNKINSFDKNRTDTRGEAFKAEYDKLKAERSQGKNQQSRKC
ncbi:hypothetical protein RYD26_12520, partial [Pasteurellaceae bacterium LIM206]|nr:hypothetical protein [Pasteurellaceae bacterium LIM206]